MMELFQLISGNPSQGSPRVTASKRQLPNLLSGSRVLLTPVSLYFIYRDAWVIAALTLLFAILTDLLDGFFARRWQQTSALGGLLDHSSDALFISVTLAALAAQELVPWPLPLLVACAFIQYLLDSQALQGLSLRASRLGRYNGICYFVLAGWLVIQRGLGIELLSDTILLVAGWCLVISTLASMADRLLTLHWHRSS
ncbi:MAG: phosphatidylglycerophosphate synthase [Candidatus Azotimanducaceae bacterium]|jgi:phosphatidylglycerophosphate synthase